MEQVITLRLKLRPPTLEKRKRLLQQQETYSRACRFFAKESERLGTTSLGRMHRASYYAARNQFDLSAAVLQQAMGKALAARRTILSHLKKGRNATEPSFKNVPVMYRNDLYKVVPIGKGIGLKLPTASGGSSRIFPVEVGEYQLRQLALLASGGARQGSGELCQARTGHWYFHLTLVVPIGNHESKEVLGIDLGMVKLATIATPDGRFTRFFDGNRVRWRRERRAEKRAHLQARGRRKRVKKMKGKETRWMTYHNHVVSKRIVEEAKKRDAAIVLEDLKGIRNRANFGKRGNRMMSSWAFGQLADFIVYKANLATVDVSFINSRNTSRTCSRCGYCEKANRKRQSEFHCRSCDYRSNADRNAAKNIASLGLMASEHASEANGRVTPRRAQGRGDSVQANPPSS